MTKDRAAEITRDRVLRWAGNLRPFTATPVLMLGIGHGPNSGEMHLNVCADIPDSEIVVLLVGVLREFEKKLEVSNHQEG